MMSCRRRGTRLEGKGAVLVDFSLQHLLADWLLDYVYPAAQEVRQSLLQRFKFGEVIEAAFGKIVGEAHDHINVRVGSGITTRNRAEYGRADDPERLQLRFAGF